MIHKKIASILLDTVSFVWSSPFLMIVCVCIFDGFIWVVAWWRWNDSVMKYCFEHCFLLGVFSLLLYYSFEICKLGCIWFFFMQYEWAIDEECPSGLTQRQIAHLTCIFRLYNIARNAVIETNVVIMLIFFSSRKYNSYCIFFGPLFL